MSVPPPSSTLPMLLLPMTLPLPLVESERLWVLPPLLPPLWCV